MSIDFDELEVGEDAFPVLLVTTVDIGQGRSGTVEVRAGDNPEDVARAFCVANGLPESVVAPLAAHLQSNIDLGPPSEQTSVLESLATTQAVSAGGAEAEEVSQPPTHADQEGHPELTELPPLTVALESPTAPPTDGTALPSTHSATSAPAWGPGSSSARGGQPSPPSAAHERLYADHFRQQVKLEEARRVRDLEIQLRMAQVHLDPVSQDLAAARNPGGYSNYGERLYVEGRLDALKREQAAQRQREAEEAADLEDCTFAPELSLTAMALKERECRMGTHGPRGPALSSKFESRMAELRRAKAAAEVHECSFRPELNKRSQALTSHRAATLKGAGIHYYDRLYTEADRRRQKQEVAAAELPPQATFAPKILRSSVVLRRLMEGRADAELAGVGLGAPARPPRVEERLLERGARYAAAAEASRAALGSGVDPATGRRYFEPALCRLPREGARRPGPVGEHLYGVAAEHAARAQSLAEAEARRVRADAASSFVNRSSQVDGRPRMPDFPERMVDALKRERFVSIFGYLAGDTSPGATIDLGATVLDESFMDTIDPEVRADVEYAARLLQAAQGDDGEDRVENEAGCDPEDTGDEAAAAAARQLRTPGPGLGEALRQVPLDLFCALMEEVLAHTKGIARTYLLPLASTRKKFEEPSFKPQIDARSQTLASRRREGGPPAHEMLYATASALQRKLEDKRAAAEAARLKECSFQPTMVARRHTVGPKPSASSPDKPDELADALEVQIKRALVRLSMSAVGDGEGSGEGVLDTIRAARFSLDAAALFGLPTGRSSDTPPDLKWLDSESEALVMELGGGEDVTPLPVQTSSPSFRGQSLLALATAAVPTGL